jgi:hypothetical protein
LLESAGGLEKLRAEAAKAGVALDLLLSTKKVKVFEAELKKLQNGIAVTTMVRQFQDAAGGAEELARKVLAAGESLDQLYTPGQSAEAVTAEIERLGKALALQDAKDGLAKTDAQLKALDRSAQLVGYDLRQLYDATTIERFNAEQKKFNDLLDAQKARLEALNKAAEGLATRTTAVVAGLTRAVTDLLHSLPADRLKAIEDAFKQAQEGGYTGGMAGFLRGAGKDLLDAAETARLEAAVDQVKAAFGRLGAYATAIFANVLRETGDITQAMAAVGPALDEMIKLQDELGIAVSGPIEKLLYLRRVMTDNADVTQALSGLTNLITGLGEAGALSGELLSTFGRDAADQWKTLQDRGVAADAALMLMQPTLQALYEAQKRYGLSVDETTQNLINMGLENGVVGDQFMDVNERIFDILLLIAETLGATIPEAYQRAHATMSGPPPSGLTATNDALTQQQQSLDDIEAARAAAAQLEAARAQVEQGNIDRTTEGIDEQVARTRELTDRYRHMREVMDQHPTEDPVLDTTAAIDDQIARLVDATRAYQNFAGEAESQLRRVRLAWQELENPTPSSPAGGNGSGSSPNTPTQGTSGFTIGGGSIQVTLVADGRKLAETTVPHIPRVVRSFGLSGNR